MGKRTLTERENALRVILRNGEPEWVPVLGDCVEMVIASPMQEYAPFGQSGKDWFGCEWEWDEASFSHGPNLRKPPLVEDICQWRDIVKFPDLDAIDWETAAKKDLEHVDRENKLVRQFVSLGPFERMNILLGMENAFVAMYEEPEEYQAMINAVCDYKVKLLEKLLIYYKPEEIFFHDDLGSANGPLISLDMYREFIKPCHKRIADVIHQHGAIYTHHSCGNMQAFIEELIDNGAQMLNPLQPLNNWEEIAEKYSDRVSFDVGAEFRANFPETTREQLMEDTHRVIDIFAPHKNLMFNCFISNVACAVNQEIMYEEARKYGGDYYQK